MPLPVSAAPAAALPSPASLLTCREAAQYLRKSERTIRLYVAQQRLRAYRVGGGVRYDRADLDALVTIR